MAGTRFRGRQQERYRRERLGGLCRFRDLCQPDRAPTRAVEDDEALVHQTTHDRPMVMGGDDGDASRLKVVGEAELGEQACEAPADRGRALDDQAQAVAMVEPPCRARKEMSNILSTQPTGD